ncbi:hypothetical protein Taro_005052 [Colocasia esculenta]|uniref:Uncharacterized protein n=1 Tax=Colocasia esculenta TaxID=4460 RepID=A0A843TWQ0_COLES|nr:hypothetical protein [Colocasia esculenta]
MGEAGTRERQRRRRRRGPAAAAAAAARERPSSSDGGEGKAQRRRRAGDPPPPFAWRTPGAAAKTGDRKPPLLPLLTTAGEDGTGSGQEAWLQRRQCRGGLQRRRRREAQQQRWWGAEDLQRCWASKGSTKLDQVHDIEEDYLEPRIIETQLAVLQAETAITSTKIVQAMNWREMTTLLIRDRAVHAILVYMLTF